MFRWDGSHRQDIGESAFRTTPSVTAPRYLPTVTTAMCGNINFAEIRDGVDELHNIN